MAPPPSPPPPPPQPVRPEPPSVPAAAAAAAARLRARRARPELYAAAKRRQVGTRGLLPAAAQGCASAAAAHGRRRCLRRARGLHLHGTLRCIQKSAWLLQLGHCGHLCSWAAT